MTNILRRPIRTPATWTRAQLEREGDWRCTLAQSHRAELLRALEHATATGKPMASLERADFPLPTLQAEIGRWMEELHNGRGFINVAGFPVAGLSDDRIAIMHWGVGLYMGTAVSQNPAGDLLGHVRDTGADPRDPAVRLYKTRTGLGFHSDGADLVGLLCIRQGRSGGENCLVSTATIYNEILRRRPDLVDLLYEPFCWDRNEEQGEGEPPYFELPICRYDAERLTFFHIPWYIRGAQRHAAAPRLTAEQNALLDLIDEIAADPALHVAMRLEPGEVNYLKNNAVLHSRTEFVDFAEPERKRHLVRLWLIAHGDWADSDAFVQQGIPKKEGVVSDIEEIERSVDGERG